MDLMKKEPIFNINKTIFILLLFIYVVCSYDFILDYNFRVMVKML